MTWGNRKIDLSSYTSLGDCPMPQIVRSLDPEGKAQLIWHNERDGLTFRIEDTYVKYSPYPSGVTLVRERYCLRWISQWHRVPKILDYGHDDIGEWIITSALPGHSAIGEVGQRYPKRAVAAIAEGLRRIHSIPTRDFPKEWIKESWVNRHKDIYGIRPLCVASVIVHGDACAPNTIIDDEGNWVGNVDFGDLTVGDQWADLAVALRSLEWNYGPGYEEYFFLCYGIEPSPKHIRYYQNLFDIES